MVTCVFSPPFIDRTEMEEPGRRPHAIAVPFPMQGHITPMLQLSRFLVARHGFSISILLTHSDLSRLSPNQSSHHDHRIQFVGLPPSGESPTSVESLVKASEDLIVPFREFVRTQKQKQSLFILSDVLMSWTQIVADEFSIARCALWTSGTCCLLVYAHLHHFVAQGRIPTADLDTSVGITGLPSYMTMADLPSFFYVEHTQDGLLSFVLRQMKLLQGAGWVLVNTFDEIDSAIIAALREEYTSTIAPVGPLLALPSTSDKLVVSSNLWEEDDRCLPWLDQWPPHSVLYVSLGSVAMLTCQQAHELAFGLEQSGKPFLWSLRPDMIENADDEVNNLPNGFRSRTAHRSLVVAWTPQQQVLTHPSIAGFLTHCGWNSVLEGITAGVPLLAWPNFFADQRMNMRMVVQEWNVGLELDLGPERLVSREEVATKVKALMDADETLRSGAEKLKTEAWKAVDEGHAGSSSIHLDLFVKSILQKVQT